MINPERKLIINSQGEERTVTIPIGKVEHAIPKCTDKRQSVTTFADILALSDSRRNEYQEKRTYQEKATTKIDSEWPITVFAIGDVHFGSVYCDTEKFLHDINLIRKTPNAYIVLMSNLIDNANPTRFPDNTMSNSMTPQQQAQGMNELLKGLDSENKILGAVRSPCHEGWTWKVAGIDINDLLFADCKFPKLDNGGILTLKLPGQDYRLALYHQFGPFNSNFNKSHGLQQMQRLLLQGKADVVIGAHHHVGEAMQTYYGHGDTRNDRVYLRSGCYKGNVSGIIGHLPDVWAQDKYGSDGEPGGEAVMLFPNERKMQAFLKPETAAEMQEAVFTFKRIQALGILGQLNEVS